MNFLKRSLILTTITFSLVIVCIPSLAITQQIQPDTIQKQFAKLEAS